MKMFKKMILVGAAFMATVSLAADQVELTDAGLKKIVAIGDEITSSEVLGVCGASYGTKVNLMNPALLENQIAAILNAEFVELVQVKTLSASRKDVKAAIQLMQQKSNVAVSDESKAAVKSLTNAVLASVKEGSKILFQAEIAGEFDADVAAIVVINGLNGEVAIVSEGYCE